jgi:glyoxylase-like metal-dependent hydrolase (beta-lactamase superfamily II)
VRLVEGVHGIGQKKGGRVHAFLFERADGLTLVDTLFDDDARDVLAYLRQLGRSPSELTHIVLTHAHRSHLGGLAALKRLSNATVYSHEWEADIIAGERKAQAGRFRPLFPLKLWPFRLGLALGKPKHQPCHVDKTLDEGDALGPLQVVHIPGHSPGHLAFFWPERRVLIAGDAIATWPSLAAGWPGFNLNEEQHRESVRRLAGFDALVVGVGHGSPITEQGPDRVRELVERESSD